MNASSVTTRTKLGVDQVLGELAGREVVAQLPAVTAEHEDSARSACPAVTASARHITSNGTFCSAVPPVCCHLREMRMRSVARLGDGVDLVRPPPQRVPTRLLFLGGIPAARRGQAGSSPRARAPVLVFRDIIDCGWPRISFAGVRSPLQLIRLGASRKPHGVAEFPIELLDPRRRLVDENHRTLVARQPLGRPDLVLPRESALGIAGELYIVGRIGIDEIAAARAERLEIAVRELPVVEGVSVDA